MANRGITAYSTTSRSRDAGVLLIEMHREDVSRHYIAPGSWLEVVEMAEGQPTRGHEGYLAR